MSGRANADVFAVLTPCNRSAVTAFSQLCDFLHQNPSRYTHHRKFLDIRPAQMSLGEALHESVDVADSTDATDSSFDLLEERVWTGEFVFSLSAKPQLPQIGWRCGFGRWSRDPLGRLDMALCLPEDGKRLRVRGNHLSFIFLVETGAFAIRVNNPTCVDTENIDITRNDGLYVLNRPQHILQMGDAKYEFSYRVSDETAFVKERNSYIRDIMKQPLPPVCELPTPSENDVFVGKWRLLGTVGRGTESVVVSATSPDNQVVVVKTLQKLRLSNQDIHNEVQRLVDIRDKLATSEDACYLLKFLEHISSEQTTYLIFWPHARYDFNVLLQDRLAHDRKLLCQLFIQALRGVRALHTANFMHRDIKPANIGVSSMDPPHAVVLDLGCTTEAGCSYSKSRPGTIGTIGYIAPEMEDSNYETYGTKVDVWSMGCVGMELLLPRKSGRSIPWDVVYPFYSADGPVKRLRFNPWRTYATFTPPCPRDIELEGQRNIYRKTSDALSNSEDPAEQLVGGMLTERPHWRPDIHRVIEEFEALQIGDWREPSAAANAPPLTPGSAEGDSRRSSSSGPRKSIKREK